MLAALLGLVLSSTIVSPVSAQPLPVVEIALEASTSPIDDGLGATSTVGQLKEFALKVSQKYGISYHDLDTTIDGESSWNPKPKCGDNGISCGIAQIRLPSHTEITKEQAEDPYFALEWMAQQFAKGNAEWWTCYRARVSHTLPLSTCPYK